MGELSLNSYDYEVLGQVQYWSIWTLIWCDVIPIKVTHILGRPWPYDCSVINDGWANTYTFVFDGWKWVLSSWRLLRLSSRRPLPRLLLFLCVNFWKKVRKPISCLLWWLERFGRNLRRNKSPEIQTFGSCFLILLIWFQMCYQGSYHLYKHNMPYLVPGASLYNLPTYSANPFESAKLDRQVEELLKKQFICESLRPRAIPATSKKDGSHRICITKHITYPFFV